MVDEGGPTDQFLKIRDSSLAHAWNWFKYQAEHRMVLLRYYLVLLTAVLAGSIVLLTKGYDMYCFFVFIYGFLVSLFFYFIDIRIKILINAGYDAMYHEERYISSLTGNNDIVFREKLSGGKLTTSLILAFFFLTNAVLFLSGSIYLLFMILYSK